MKKQITFGLIAVALLLFLIRVISYNPNKNSNGEYYKTKKNSFLKSKVKYKDISYGRKGHQIFDFYTPDNGIEEYNPLLIILHSGGFISGNKKEDAIFQLAEEISKYDINVAAINYDKFKLESLLKPQNPVKTIKEKIFSTFRDLSLAVRYFKDNAGNYKIEPDNIFVAGISSGGIIALTTTFFDNNDITRHFELDGQCLHCDGLTNSEFSVKGIISINGAMLSTSVIDQNDNIQTLLIYGGKDGIVPTGKGKPFDKYMNDIELNIPGIAQDLSIGDFDIDYRPKIQLHEQYVKIIRDKIFPEMYGSIAIMQRMKQNNLSVKMKKIKNGAHNLFFKEDGTETGNLNVIVKEITTFINSNRGI